MNRVVLFDTEYPLFNKEYPRADFDRMIKENPMNDHLNSAVPNDKDKSKKYTDAFLINEENESVYWMYYNPDSTSGGQYVTNTVTFDEIRDVLENAEPENFFKSCFSFIKSRACRCWKSVV